MQLAQPNTFALLVRVGWLIAGWRLALIALSLMGASWVDAADPQTLVGEVIGVSDGDTVTVLVDRTQYKVRLAEIDAPEKRQPYGKTAKKVLAEKVFRKSVVVHFEKRDRYSRIIGKILLGDRNINREMIQEGHAWVYRRYSKDPELVSLEARAKSDRRGLWRLQEDQRIPPWEWRRTKRNKTRAQ